MRRVLAAALLLLVPDAALAEKDLGPLIVSGQAQVGGRGVWGDDDSAKFEEYRDVHEGAFGSLRFLIEDAERRHFLQGWLDDMGERDQQYRFEGGRYGLWGIRGLYSEIPHVFSNRAVTPYFDSGNFVCTPGAACDGVSGVSGPWLQLVPGFDRDLDPDDPAYAAQLAALSTPTSLEYRVIEGEGEIFYRPTEEWDLSAGYRILDRDGNRGLALGFGSPGGNYANLAVPIKERTHEARVDAQYVRESWNLGLGYLGSFFVNDLDFFQADNPLTSPADETTGDPAVGRFALAPDNSAHLVSLSGAAVLPTSFPARVAGSFAWGLQLQDDDFLPVTSNEAINLTGDPLLDLTRGSLDGKVQTINGHLVLTARPRPDLTVEGRYRVYDYNNFTDERVLSGEAPNDRNLRPGVENIAYRYRRHSAQSEVSWSPAESSLTATLGFGWELWDRDREREVHTYNEYGPTARIDWKAASWARLRASYAFLAGVGDNYAALPGALDGLRKYSQADRVQHDFSLLTQLDPLEELGFTITSGFRLTDYDNSPQGLTDDNRWNVGLDTRYRPHERVGLFAYYTFDYIWAFQEQGDFTWTSTSFDTAHNGSAGVDFTLLPERLDGELSYFIQLARAKSLGSGSATDFPTLKNTLQAVMLRLDAHVLDFLTLRGIYRWEKYDWKNFHEDFPITDSQGDIYLQNRIADYNAHIFSLSAIVKF